MRYSHVGKHAIINRINRISIVPYGRNFRGAGGRSQEVFSKSKINIIAFSVVLNVSAEHRNDYFRHSRSVSHPSHTQTRNVQVYFVIAIH